MNKKQKKRKVKIKKTYIIGNDCCVNKDKNNKNRNNNKFRKKSSNNKNNKINNDNCDKKSVSKSINFCENNKFVLNKRNYKSLTKNNDI